MSSSSIRLLLGACLALIPARDAAASNVLLIVIDDVGVDRVAAYHAHPRPARTPTLDGLAADGVLFEHCWASPYCSPTRATILTGRHGFRTGIGTTIFPDDLEGLSLGEWTLPEVLAAGAGGTIRTAAVGKWHLARGLPVGQNPVEQAGFEQHAGNPGNLGGEDEDWKYFHFTKLVGPTLEDVHRYATTDEVDDTLAAIAGFQGEPWFVYLALHSAHLPYHLPPPLLLDQPLEGQPDDYDVPARHRLMVEAIDAEIGRLLAELDPAVLAETTVLVVGDNGTQGEALDAPADPSHGKGTMFEGGLRVPLLVAGAGVAPAARGARCVALVQTTDLFATVGELLGVDVRAVVPADVPLDSVGLAPYFADPARPSLRAFAYAEHFRPNHAGSGPFDKLQRAVRNDRYKLIRNGKTGVDRLFDLRLDPLEQRNLLKVVELPPEARQAYRDLRRGYDALFPE